MNRMLIRCALLCATVCLLFVIALKAFAATNHVIVGNPNITWTYNGKASSSSQPVVIDDLQVGDTIEIRVPDGAVMHGFIPIIRAADGTFQKETTDPVVMCGEDPKSKKNAALQEMGCTPGVKTKIGAKFKNGSLTMTVLPAFKGSLDFYCTVHHLGMSGSLKLSSAH